MNIKDIFQSETYSKLIKVLAVLFVVLIIFATGMYAGYSKAEFVYNWRNNYTRSINDPLSPFAPFEHDMDDTNPHGAIGTIVSTNFPSFIVKGPHQAEEIVVVGSSTMVRNMRAPTSTDILRPGEQVIVIGQPDQSGRIQATFVRVMPKPPQFSTSPRPR
jgi:hypothetical protein